MKLILILLSVFILLHQGKGEICFAPLDLAIVLDMSGSISDDNWKLMKDFTESIINDITISPSNTQVSIMTFATTIEYISQLKTYSEKQSLLGAFRAYSRKVGLTYSDKALEALRTTTFTAVNGDRPDVKNIVMFMTDGASNNVSLTQAQATNLHMSGQDIHVFVIGIANYNAAEVNTIASDPDSFYVNTISKFTFLNKIATILGPRFCQIGLDVIIGAACSNSTDCSTENSACSSGICSCSAQNFIYNHQQDICEPRKSTGKTPVYCNTASDCSFLYGASCSSGICECPSGAVCPSCQIDDPCDQAMDCSSAIPGWMCSSSEKQGCKSSRRRKSTYVCEVIKVGDACTVDENCAEVRAVCRNSRCQCEEGIEEKGNTCLKIIIGEACTDNTNCSTDDSVCRSGICSCADQDFIYNHQRDRCEPWDSTGAVVGMLLLVVIVVVGIIGAIVAFRHQGSGITGVAALQVEKAIITSKVCIQFGTEATPVAGGEKFGEPPLHAFYIPGSRR